MNCAVLRALGFLLLPFSPFNLFLMLSDIQFWRSRKTLEGLSVRSVFFNVFQSVIVLLYVMDNETNTVVIISCFVGLLIEIWKINKAVDVKVSVPDLKECADIVTTTVLNKCAYFLCLFA